MTQAAGGLEEPEKGEARWWVGQLSLPAESSPFPPSKARSPVRSHAFPGEGMRGIEKLARELDFPSNF